MNTKSIALPALGRQVVAGVIGLCLMVSCFFAFAPQARAAQLTEPQIQAILNLLMAFNVPQATINNVSNILHKKN